MYVCVCVCVCVCAEVCLGTADTETWRMAPDGHDLESRDPLVEAAAAPSCVAFCASGPHIDDDSEALASELQLWCRQVERGRAQSGQHATVASSEMPRVDDAAQIVDDGQYKFLLA
jgi:hypothetical protein